MTRRRRHRVVAAPHAVVESAERPTREWQQHHAHEIADDRLAGLSGVARRLERYRQLALEGRISREELDACERYRTDAEIAGGAHVGSGGDGSGVEADGRLDAATRYRQAQDAVGLDVAALLDAIVVRDEPWEQAARIIGRRPGGPGIEAARRATVLAIEALARYYSADGYKNSA